MKKVDKISYEEFLDLCDEDTLAEWLDGDLSFNITKCPKRKKT